jgi:hypothetical protein
MIAAHSKLLGFIEEGFQISESFACWDHGNRTDVQ